LRRSKTGTLRDVAAGESLTWSQSKAKAEALGIMVASDGLNWFVTEGEMPSVTTRAPSRGSVFRKRAQAQQTEPINPDKPYRIAEVCSILGVSYDTARRKMSRMPAVKNLGTSKKNLLVITGSDLLKWQLTLSSKKRR
jgi:hypothetical protein